MDDLLSEKEQIEQMRTWWSEYGNYVIGGIVMGAALLFGFNYMQNAKLDAELAASALYDEVANSVVDEDVEEAETLAGQLWAEHPDSNYSAQAKLALSRLYMDGNRDQDAANVLQELLDSSKDEGFKMVARLRLARIMLYQDKASEVLELLDGVEEGAFAARYAEVRGDAHFALGQFSEARDAFQLALAEAGQGATVDQQFVQLKLLDLPIETFAAAEEPAADTVPADDTAEVADDVADDMADDEEGE